MMRMGIRRGMKMKPIFEPLEADRKANMKGRAYIYVIIIGVASESQGWGFGGKLLRAVFEESEGIGIPIYLETTTETNVSLYERLGFRVLNKITLPVVDLPQWEMLREPSA
jgi:ribosomal protein S18 acetylase RimI-like enzyme